MFGKDLLDKFPGRLRVGMLSIYQLLFILHQTINALSDFIQLFVHWSASHSPPHSILNQVSTNPESNGAKDHRLDSRRRECKNAIVDSNEAQTLPLRPMEWSTLRATLSQSGRAHSLHNYFRICTSVSTPDFGLIAPPDRPIRIWHETYHGAHLDVALLPHRIRLVYIHSWLSSDPYPPLE